MRGHLTIEQRQKQIITRLKNENARLRERVIFLEERNTLQTKTVETLKLQLEELKRIIFRKKEKKDYADDGNKTNEKARNPQKQPRSKDSYKRNIPEEAEVTQEILHTVDTCPHCKSNLKNAKCKDSLFYVENILLPKMENEEVKTNPSKIAEKHTVERKWCGKCRKWVSSVSLPSTPVILGENVKLYIVYLSILLRLSYEQIKKLFKDTFNLSLSDGEIGNILERESDTLKIPFEQLKESIRKQKSVHFDETSWNVQSGEQGNFAWVMTGSENEDAVYLLGRSRGKGNAKELMGKKKNLIGISDDYGAYRHLFSVHQLCWAHPQRKFRDLATSDAIDEEKRKHCRETYESFSKLYEEVREVIKKPFCKEEREKKRKMFLKKIEEISKENKRDPQKLKILKASLQKNKEKYVVCVIHEGVPADNNKAERALRHLVIKRRTSFGSRTQKGADQLSILFSVLLSLWRRGDTPFFPAYAQVRESKQMV